MWDSLTIYSLCLYFFLHFSPCQGSPDEPTKLLFPSDDAEVNECVRTHPWSGLTPTDSTAAENAQVRLAREIEKGVGL